MLNDVPQHGHDHVDNAARTINLNKAKVGPNISLRIGTDGQDNQLFSYKDEEKNMVTATIELPGVSKEKVNFDINHGEQDIFITRRECLRGG